MLLIAPALQGLVVASPRPIPDTTERRLYTRLGLSRSAIFGHFSDVFELDLPQPRAAHVNAYAWDAEGRTVTIDSGTFTYDALDRRLDFGASGSYQQYFYPPFDLNYNFGQAVGATGQLGLRLPSPGGGQVNMAPSGVTGYRHPNWQGSQVANSTTTRTVAADNAFTPFGERYAETGYSGYFAGMLMQYPYMTDGYQADERLYHDGQGRWVSPDPAGLGAVDLTNPQSLNRYVYVMNDPLDNVDPSGLFISSGGIGPPGGSNNQFGFGVICNPEGDWSYTGTPGQTPCNSIVNQLIGGANLFWGQTGGGHGGGGSAGLAAAVPAPNNAPQPINWKKVGSCLVDSTLKHYGLDALTAGSGALAIPISKSLVPPFRMIGEPTTNLLSVLGHYVEINVPRITIDGLASTNLLRIAGRANPYVAGALLAIDVGMISYDTYQCYQKQ